jgi:acetylornithine aminotransferase/acetylornithine/N-succinyldiaminopimelate aminotransferase
VPGFVFGRLNDLEHFSSLVDDQTAAIMVETIQGESGINPCTAQFLIGLRRLCDQRNLLLLLDEVQCGIGRTGRFYAFEHAGVRADAVAMAKGLGGGFPIGAMWVGERAADLFQPGSHGTTFGGTPLACAAALAVLDVIEREKLLAHVTDASVPWLAGLAAVAKDFPKQVVAIRGRGFLVGVQLASDVLPYVAALREGGLLTVPSGGNVIRLLPPLVTSSADLARSVEIIRSVLSARA